MYFQHFLMPTEMRTLRQGSKLAISSGMNDPSTRRTETIASQKSESHPGTVPIAGASRSRRKRYFEHETLFRCPVAHDAATSKYN
jgi:hypothetical protein